MALNQNPMGIGAAWQGNFQQPNTGAPSVSSAVASYPVGTNVLNIAAPLPRFVEPGLSSKDDPQGSIRGHL
jgi:hypothetical protein